MSGEHFEVAFQYLRPGDDLPKAGYEITDAGIPVTPGAHIPRGRRVRADSYRKDCGNIRGAGCDDAHRYVSRPAPGLPTSQSSQLLASVRKI